MATGALKPINKFLQQAKKMDKVEPIIAYYCRVHAMKTALKAPNKTAEDKQTLASIMTWLEQNREVIKGITPADAKQRVEAFAVQVFNHADNADRQATPTKQVALIFNDAFIFFEVCKQFGELDADLSEQMRYALWKVTDIFKAIKEGRSPKSGPPVDDALAAEFGDDGLGGGGDGSGMDVRNDGSRPATSPAAAPVAPAKSSPTSSPPSHGGNGFDFLSSPPANNAYAHAPAAPVASAFSFIDHDSSASSSSSAPHASTDYPSLPFAANGQPMAMATATAYPQYESAPVLPPASSPSYGQPMDYSNYGASPPAAAVPAPTAVARPVATPAKAVRAPPAAATPIVRTPTPVAAAQPVLSYGGNGVPPGSLVIVPAVTSLDRSQSITECEKMMKHAQSALRFQDVPTAIVKLQEAIAVLLKHNRKA